MQLTTPQHRALRTLADNPGRTAVRRHTGYVTINGNTANSLTENGLITTRTHTTEAGTEIELRDLTDTGRAALDARDAKEARKAAKKNTGPTVPAELADRPMPKPVRRIDIREVNELNADRLTRLTPPVIDSMLATLHSELAHLDSLRDHAWNTLYNDMGVEKVRVRRGRGWTSYWPLARDELATQAREVLDGTRDISETVLRYNPLYRSETGQTGYRLRIRGILDAIRKHTEEIRTLNEGPAALLDAEWDRRGGWTRFYLCTNTDGHIHTGRSCNTVHATTHLVLKPELSGLTEKDAVRAYGPILCSVCYPTAPLAWTEGNTPDTSGDCPTSRTYAPRGSYNPRHLSPYARCPKCKEMVSITSTGKFRQHDAK